MVPTPMANVTVFTFLLLLHMHQAWGHGFVQNVIVDGKPYPGWNPFMDPFSSPAPSRVIRKIPSDGPITSASDPNLACNTGGESGAALVADASAGSTVMFEWTNWPADHLGPVSTYMTSCGQDCKTFDVNGAKWFKIDAAGYDSGSWASANLIQRNNTWTSVIPNELAAGSYLMRNEIVALHSTGAPQYYPSCTQVNIRKGGTRKPSSSETVEIPGLYDQVNFPDIWSGGFDTWPAPGPPVVFSGGKGEVEPNPTSPGSVTNSGLTSATTSFVIASPTSNPEPFAAMDSTQCRLVRNPGVLGKRHVLLRRRHS